MIDDTQCLLFDAVPKLPLIAGEGHDISTHRTVKIKPKGDFLQFYGRRDNPFAVNSLLMFADRVVIPSALILTPLRQFHRSRPDFAA